MKKSRSFRVFFLLFSAALFCLSGCSRKAVFSDSAPGTSVSYQPGCTYVRTPKTGDTVISEGPLTLDFSFQDQGYFIGTLSDEDTKINLQVTGPDQVIYKYFIDEPGSAVFPFTAGDGAYVILAFEHIGDSQYCALTTYSLFVELENEFLPFLYPNQYVDFSAESEAVSLAASLSADAATDLDALNQIYQYVTTHIVYDDEKAASVQPGYLPDIDETLQNGRGICFDYASLTAAMLRSLSIPTRLEIGYSGSIRHAWVDVYIESMGWVENAIEFNGSEWTLMDPTFAAAVNDSDLTKEQLTDPSNYSVQYIR